MKRFISFTILLVLLISLLITPTMVYADTNLNIVTGMVNKANANIHREIVWAQRDADAYIRAGLDYKVAERIEDLIEVTNAISERTIEEAAEFGIEVICEYIEVDVGGIVVLVDPLRIVGV